MGEEENRLKTILLTGGGTAGHVTPNLALLSSMRERSYRVHYAGTKNGIERELILREKIPYHCISAGKLRRYFDFRNITDIFRITLGFFQSLFIVNKVRPSVVFSKGGFVSCPVVWAAWIFRVPVVIHESDITPGLANKLSSRFALKICFSFPETASYLPPQKRVHTGLPVREALLTGNAQKGKEFCGFRDDKPVILIIGGSQGSKIINETIRESLPELLAEFNICHLCGKGALSETSTEGYCQFEYVNEELSGIMALADLVISRSGATTLFELLALKKPNLLIPLSTGASRGDQILNARSFEKQGYSRVLLQEELSRQTLMENVNALFSERNRYILAMGKAAEESGVKKVMEVIESLIPGTA